MSDRELESYVASVTGRLRVVTTLRLLSTVLLALVMLTIAGAVYLQLEVPSGAEVAVLRVLAVAVLVAFSIWLFHRLTDWDVTAEVERRLPSLTGRLVTWRDALQQPASLVFRELLAREVLAQTADRPPQRLVGWREWTLPTVVAAMLLGALALLGTGSGGFSLSAQRFWLGDRLSGAAPLVTVTPGDATVAQGFDVVVEARAENFSSESMQLFARFDESSLWQEAPMSRLADDVFGFVFVAVDQPIDYYIRSGGINSQRFRITVADLPRVTGVTVAADYPQWSGLDDATSVDGDIVALSGTRIDLEIELDRVGVPAVLVLENEPRDLEVADSLARGTFTVEQSGHWHVAIEHEGEMVRISERFSIELMADEPPEITYVWPGRDRQATAIEEVALEFSVTDDFAVRNLELYVSVNGGDWQRSALDPSTGDALLELESLTAPDGRSLTAGDVLSLYALAEDHASSTRSSLYFVDVRPFDRRYRESSQSGGGQGGGDPLDVAQRQKEILSATWNLVNKQANTAEDELAREADVVAMLQRKLAEQVEVLIERSRARSLDQDNTVARFVEALDQALLEMPEAAQLLDRGSLEAALAPEGRALAHLRAAESTIRDMDVAMGESRGRGTLRDSLSELMDLELDTERNRYETPQSLSSGEDSPQADPAWEELAELAERQQQLAENSRTGQQTPESRWQQQQLQRELEALRERLEQRRSRSAGPDRQSLEEAISAVDQASETLQRADGDSQSLQQGSEALRSASNSLAQRGLEQSAQQLNNLRAAAESLLETQNQVMERLRAAQERSVTADEGEGIDPWQDFTMLDDVATKATMRDQLGGLRADLAEAIRDAGNDEILAESLIGAQNVLDEQRIDERLAATADAFEMGRPLYALAHEEIVQRGLQQLSDQLNEARARRSGSGSPGTPGADENRAALQTLRAALASARRNGDLDAGEIDTVNRRTQALAGRLGDSGAGTPDLEALLRESRENYAMRGRNTADPERLYRMTEAALDLLEVAVSSPQAGDLQAQDLRAPQRDAQAVVEYYRRLSDEAGQ